MSRNFVTLEGVNMEHPGTPPTKEEFLAALSENGINNLGELVEAIIPDNETGGYRFIIDENSGFGDENEFDFTPHRLHVLRFIANWRSLWGEVYPAQ